MSDNPSLALEFVHQTVAGWPRGDYSYSLQSLRSVEVEGKEEELYTFLVTFSRPLKTRPVPPIAVHLTVEVTVAHGGPSLAGRFEQEKQQHREVDLPSLVLPKINEIMSRKERLVEAAGVSLIEGFDKSRLPASYAEEKEEKEPAPAAEESKATSTEADEATEAAEATPASPSAEVPAFSDAELESAISIQRLSRGRQARKRVEGLKAERDAATSVQRISRGRMARRRVEEMKAERNAATNVQRMARGRAARKRVADIRSSRTKA